MMTPDIQYHLGKLDEIIAKARMLHSNPRNRDAIRAVAVALAELRTIVGLLDIRRA